jgi:HSP20 family protein
MDIKKLVPWNWFKKEEEEESVANVPVKMKDSPSYYPAESGAANPLAQLHREVDKLFENAFRGFGLSPFQSDFFTPLTPSGLMKPHVDIGVTDKEYTITAEVPGVGEKDVKVEVANNTMTISGEKKQEKDEKEKNYYRVERSYGSFQRVLSLPEDANQEDIKATFKDGVLTIKMGRKALPKSEVKQVEIK